MHGVNGVSASGIAAQGVSPRLISAAHEFEAQMMKELLGPLAADGREEDGADSGSTGALGEFASEALGRAVSACGGLGIARQIIHSLSHERNHPQSAARIDKLQQDTVLRTNK